VKPVAQGEDEEAGDDAKGGRGDPGADRKVHVPHTL
jgi:hypothetical protein